jgi:hypothetical protein
VVFGSGLDFWHKTGAIRSGPEGRRQKPNSDFQRFKPTTHDRLEYYYSALHLESSRHIIISANDQQSLPSAVDRLRENITKGLMDLLRSTKGKPSKEKINGVVTELDARVNVRVSSFPIVRGKRPLPK